MKSKLITLTMVFSTVFISCNNNKSNFDASGSFEAVETIISAETNGKILVFDVEEGTILKAGQLVGYIDSTQLYLNKLQLVQNQKAILTGRPDIKVQLEALQKELETAISDMERIENLVKGNVASQKQLDDAISRVTVLKSKISATKNTLSTTTNTLNEQGGTVTVQLAQVEDQLRKCRIVNPVNGTVLTKYTNAFEMAAAGKPLYKIADLSEIILRVFITSNQLPQVKLNQTVKVHTDDGSGGFSENEGVITWISDKAEFTPKTIQTKEERANMVYAVKIKMKNDGTYKIGMYGEINF
jgi:HlyD family secretion protein